METTRLYNMGLSPTLMAGQVKGDYQESLNIESGIVKDCARPCDGKYEEGMVVVEDIEVTEVTETAIWVFLAMKTC